jgi:hypothetical protein
MTDTAILSREHAEQIRLRAMLDAVTAQRNNAMNEVANLAAENAVLKSAIEHLNLKLAESKKADFSKP